MPDYEEAQGMIVARRNSAMMSCSRRHPWLQWRFSALSAAIKDCTKWNLDSARVLRPATLSPLENDVMSCRDIHNIP